MCSSSSIDISVHMGQLSSVMRLVQQDLERGEVGVPLDQRGYRAEALERRGVEFPDRLRNPGAVIVDQDVHALGDVMAGEVDLAETPDWQRVARAAMVDPSVPLADIDVVDIS